MKTANAVSSDDNNGGGDNGGVSSETNERICNHMNNDHAISVYAMAKQQLMINNNNPWGSATVRSQSHITEAKLLNVTLEGCTIKVITCSGEFCQQHKVVYPFVPPLTTSNGLRSKMVQLHSTVTRPHPLLIMKHQPISIAILFGIAMLFYGTILQQQKRQQQYQGGELLSSSTNEDTDDSILNMILYSSRICPMLFWVTVVAHVYEMVHVLYHSSRRCCFATKEEKPSFFLSWTNTILWCTVVFIGGYPFWNEFTDLLQQYHYYTTDKEQKKKKKKKKKKKDTKKKA